MPFRHPERSHDLHTRIGMEVRERLEEAIDYVCMDALVQSRKARGLPAPAADSADDRQEFASQVRAFLRLLRAELGAGLTDEQQRRVAAAEAAPGDEPVRLLAVQVTLARILPDYWQRFEQVRARFASGSPASRGEGRGLLARLFGRG